MYRNKTNFLADPIHYKAKNINMDKKEDFVMIKQSSHQEDLKVINMNAINRAPKDIKLNGQN